VIKEDIFPKSVITLDTSDDANLFQRIRDNMTEQEVFGTHNTAADMERRIKAYRNANNSKIAEPSLK
jgi:hypothetical protein